MKTQAKGLTSTSLSLLAAAAGSGKTGIAMGVARALVDQGIPVEPFKAVTVINVDDDPVYQRFPIWQAGILHNCGAARLPVKPWHNPVTVIRSHSHAARGDLYISGELSGSVPTREEDLLHIGDLSHRLRRLCRSAVLDALAHVRTSGNYVLVEGAGAAGELPPDDDLANAVVPAALGCPALLVLNAARSGHMAAFLGVSQLLGKQLRSLLSGYVINQVRTEAHLQLVRTRLADLTDLPCLGTLAEVHQPPEYDGSPAECQRIYQRRAEQVTESGLLHRLINVPLWSLTGMTHHSSDQEGEIT